VKVLDSNGVPVVGATVRGAWSGLVTTSGDNAVTDSAGIARFTSPQTKSRGTFVFTVGNVTQANYTYAPTTNTETSDSIQR
jgi:hypothetical protein